MAPIHEGSSVGPRSREEEEADDGGEERLGTEQLSHIEFREESRRYQQRRGSGKQRIDGKGVQNHAGYVDTQYGRTLGVLGNGLHGATGYGFTQKRLGSPN